MKKINYNLTGFWMAPHVPLLLTIEQLESMLVDVKGCQEGLGTDIAALDMATNKGHERLMDAVHVSLQLRRYRQNVESLIKYTLPATDQVFSIPDVYTTTMAHERDQARGRK